MNQSTKTIDGIPFVFQGFMEGNDEVCRVTVDNDNFKMIVGESGEWEIWQQVPNWIKRLEKDLREAIDKEYC